MNCEVCVDIIPIYVDGELDCKRSELVEVHIRQCESCRIVYEQTIAFKEDLINAMRMRQFKYNCVSAVIEQIQSKRTRLPARFWIPAAAIIILVVCLFSSLQLKSNRDVSTVSVPFLVDSLPILDKEGIGIKRQTDSAIHHPSEDINEELFVRRWRKMQTQREALMSILIDDKSGRLQDDSEITRIRKQIRSINIRYRNKEYAQDWDVYIDAVIRWKKAENALNYAYKADPDKVQKLQREYRQAIKLKTAIYNQLVEHWQDPK